MVKPIVITAPCSTNAVSAKDLLEQDGSGYVKKFDGSGVPKGIALVDKDASNNVPMMVLGIVDMPAAAATYNFGAVVEGNATGVTAYSSGTRLGFATKTQIISTTYSTTDTLQILFMPALA